MFKFPIKAILLALISGYVTAVFADGTHIETDSFLFQLPEGWVTQELSKQPKIVGPNNELVILSSVKVSGSGNPEELRKIIAELKNNLISSMEGAANQPELVMLGSVNQIAGKNFPLYYLQAETKDKSYFLDQYGVIHTKNVLLITVEGKMEFKQSSSVVRKAIETIKWR